MIEINTIYNEDCLEGMKRIPDNTIDLTVTSPPYDNLRTYNGNNEAWNETVWKAVIKELHRVTAEGGVVVWVVGDRVKNGSETLIPFEQAQYFKKVGFNVYDTMIYQKNAMPYPEQTRYIQCFEFMFIFSKGKPKAHNLLKEKTKGYKPSKTSTQRNADGTTTELKYEQGKKYRNRWNVWVYDVGYNKTTKDKIAFQHPAMFPEQLANDHIISWSNEGDIVLDPFMGSGTTAKMAILNNRNYIGFELDKHYCEIANERVQKAMRDKGE